MATPRNFSVYKAFAILKSFRNAEDWLTSSEISRRANLPTASGYRIIQTLEEVLSKFLARGVEVTLCEANWSLKRKLLKAGTLQRDGQLRYFDDIGSAVQQAPSNLAPDAG